MKFTTVFIFSFLIISYSVFGAGLSEEARPDLSGTWKLIESPKAKVRDDNIPDGDHVLLITQRGPEITILVKKTIDAKENLAAYVYFSDGRGEKGMVARDVRSVTKWEGSKLVTSFSFTVGFPSPADWHNIGIPRTGEFLIKHKWELSKDGKKLTRITILRSRVTPSDSPPMWSERKSVYSRVS